MLPHKKSVRRMYPLARMKKFAYPPVEDEMNKDKVKGTVDDAAGRAKRQVGEWTGDTRTQAEGAAQRSEERRVGKECLE